MYFKYVLADWITGIQFPRKSAIFLFARQARLVKVDWTPTGVVHVQAGPRTKSSNAHACYACRGQSTGLYNPTQPPPQVSHLISEEEPSASHMCARISSHTYDRQK
jgi:hypothetical protein